MLLALRLLDNLEVSLNETSESLDAKLTDTSTRYKATPSKEEMHYILFEEGSGAELVVRGGKVVHILSRGGTTLNKLFDTTETTIRGLVESIQQKLEATLNASIAIGHTEDTSVKVDLDVQLTRLNITAGLYIFACTYSEKHGSKTTVRVAIKKVGCGVYIETLELVTTTHTLETERR